MTLRRTIYQQLHTAAAKAVSALGTPPDKAKFLSLVDQVNHSVPEATEDQIRRALRKAVRQKFQLLRPAAGSPPNTSVVLSAQEILFIKRKFGGSRSKAIHAGLALLMEGK